MRIIGDRYEVLNRLGIGGMGEVFLGRTLDDGMDIVIKCLREIEEEDESTLVRFADEARIMARLHHPNIVRTHEFFEDAGVHYLILEYVNGDTIANLGRTLNAANQSIPIQIVLKLGVEAADALAFAHNHTDASGRAMRIVHRDVSPQNLMISEDGRAKLLDFGIAKSSLNRHVTATHTVTGKASYMSPEQSRCMPLDGRSDQFALGIVLYELLSCQTVFGGTDLMQILRRVAQCRFPPLHVLCPEVPRRVSDVLERATRLRPEDRYASCTEFAEALAQCLNETGGAWTTAQYRAWRQGYLDLVRAGTRPRRFKILDEYVRSTNQRDTNPRVRVVRDSEELTSLFDSPVSGEEGGRESGTIDISAATNLAELDDGLIGRDVELDDVTHQLRIGRSLVSLLGPGGIGKTRLAQAIGQRSLGRYEGGVWFCDLSAAISESEIIATLAETLGFQLSGPQPRDQMVQMLSHLPATLIILDNFEQVAEDASTTIGRWLRKAPQLQFLVTTRVKLKLDGEYVRRVGPLSLADGIQLFIQRGSPSDGLSDPDQSQILAQSIVSHLDGLPLAIELAAAQLRTRSVQDLEQQIHRRFRVLSDDNDGRHQRHSTIWATIEWSWNLLDHELRAGLSCCALFPTDFDLDAAAMVCGLSVRRMRRVLRHLSDSSLLMQREAGNGELRYYLLESIREFAHAQLGEQAADAQIRFSTHFSRYGDPAGLANLEGPGGAALYQRLRGETQNLRAALRYARKNDRVIEQAGIAFALAELAVLLWQNPLGADVLEFLELEALPPNLALRGRFYVMKLLTMAGQGEDAQRHCTQGIKDAEILNDPALAIQFEAHEIMYLGPVGSPESRKRAVQLCQDLRIDVHPHTYVVLLAQVARVSTAPHLQTTAYQQCIKLARQYGFEIVEPKLLSDYGNVLLRECREREAIELYREAVDLCRERALHARELNTLVNMAGALVHLARFEEAETLYQRLVRQTARRGHLLLRSFALLEYASLLGAQGRFEEGVKCADEAERLADSVSWPRFVAHAASIRGELLLFEGRHAEAEVDLKRATEMLEGILPVEAALALCHLVELEAAREEFDAAQAYLTRVESFELDALDGLTAKTSAHFLAVRRGDSTGAAAAERSFLEACTRLSLPAEHILRRRFMASKQRAAGQQPSS